MRSLVKFAETNISTTILLAAGIVATLFGALNSTLIFDDPFLYEHFSKALAEFGFVKTLGILFLNLDLHLGVPEYRTYGLSKVLHFFLWLLWGEQAWAYSAFIGITQTATALLIFRMSRRWSLAAVQSLLLAMVWLLSPFAVTTCFHHYSYLILPVQLTVGFAFFLQRWMAIPVGPAWSGTLALAIAGVCIALTGELHLPLSMAALGLVLLKTESGLGLRWRLASFGIFACSLFGSVLVHNRIWVALGPVVEVHRFNFSMPTLGLFWTRSLDHLVSLPKGAVIQMGQIFGYSALSARVAVLSALVMCVGLFYFSEWSKRESVTASVRDAGGAGSTTVPFAWVLLLVLSAFAVVWARAAFFSQTGDVLPRRYGYVPYSLACMGIVCALSASGFRKRFAEVTALAFTGVVLGSWAALQFVCLPQVRSQDAQVWEKVRAAVEGKSVSYVLFVNALNMSRPKGFDSPGIRGTQFPILFESPFMRYGWQGQYVKTAFGVRGTGDEFEPAGQHHVNLKGQLNGIHFVKGEPLTAALDSMVVVMDRRYTLPGWNAGLEDVQVLDDWRVFQSTAAYLRIKIDVGWESILAGIFNDPAQEVAVDLGQKALVHVTGLLPDKAFGDAPISNPVLANYGFESGDDAVYAPNGSSGAPLPYLSTNRHGNFVYRLDFLNKNPKIISIDVFDWWANNTGYRILDIQLALGDRWIDVGAVDTYSIARREPFSIKIPVDGVDIVKIRFRVDSASKDIPFANGIRIKLLTAG